MQKRFFIGCWVFAILFLFLYSFTQVDLSLTLSRASFLQSIQKAFQYIGYFNRPLSTYIYIAILVLLFTLYIWSLFLIHKKRIQENSVRLIIIVMSVILLFSYSAFSYDIFNYIFDAKIVTHYHEDPYTHKAQDFPGDPMLSFMRWVHRVYPYGPAWLGVTIPLSFIGMGYFLPTFFLFKALMVASFLGSVYLIYKIAQLTKVIDPLFAVAFFAFNPLIIIESLISAHNDIVMMFLALLSVYLMLQKKMITSLGALVLSAGIKFATLFLAPIELVFLFKKNFPAKHFLFGCLLLMIIPLYLATVRTTFQPWYLLYPLTFAPFFGKKYFVYIPTFFLSIFSLTQYIPYLYLGNWDPPVPMILNQMMIAGIACSVVGVAFYFFFHKNAK